MQTGVVVVGGVAAGLVVMVLVSMVNVVGGQTPCYQVDSQLTLPCLCATSGPNISINCDNVAFPGDFPLLPFK